MVVVEYFYIMALLHFSKGSKYSYIRFVHINGVLLPANERVNSVLFLNVPMRMNSSGGSPLLIFQIPNVCENTLMLEILRCPCTLQPGFANLFIEDNTHTDSH